MWKGANSKAGYYFITDGTNQDAFYAILFGQIRQTYSYCGYCFRLWLSEENYRFM